MFYKGHFFFSGNRSQKNTEEKYRTSNFSTTLIGSFKADFQGFKSQTSYLDDMIDAA